MADLAARVIVWLFLERQRRVTSWLSVSWTNAQLLIAAALAAYLATR